MPNNLAWAIEWMSVPAITWDGEGLAGVHGTDYRILFWIYEVWNAYLIFDLQVKKFGRQLHIWSRTQEEVRAENTHLGNIFIYKDDI